MRGASPWKAERVSPGTTLDREPEPTSELARKEKGWVWSGLRVAPSANRREWVSDVFSEELQEHRNRASALWLRVEKRGRREMGL